MKTSPGETDNDTPVNNSDTDLFREGLPAQAPEAPPTTLINFSMSQRELMCRAHFESPRTFLKRDYLGPPPGLGSVVVVRPKMAETPVLNEGSVFKVRPKAEIVEELSGK
ncbi:hypothetical protein BIW11_06029, partial [Tropilaelaps mercedesae]